MFEVEIVQPVNGDWPVKIDGKTINIRSATGEPNRDDWSFWAKSSRAFSSSLADHGAIEDCIDYFRIETGSEPQMFVVVYSVRAGIKVPKLSDVYLEKGNFTVKFSPIG